MILNRIHILSGIILLMLFVTAISAPADNSASGAGNTENSGVIKTFLLTQQSAPASKVRCYLSENKKDVVFKKEPVYKNKDIIKGVMDIPSGLQIPYAYDKKDKKLYIDYNKNFDLTDDNSSEFPSPVIAEKSSSDYSPIFNINYPTTIDNFVVPYKINLNIYNNGGRQLNFDITSSSYWQGKIELNGGKYLLCVIDNCNGKIERSEITQINNYYNFSDMFWIKKYDSEEELTSGTLSILSKEEKLTSATKMLMVVEQDNYINNLTGKVYLDNALYTFTYKFIKPENEPPFLELKIAESSSMVSEAVLEGKFINRLEFYGDTTAVFYEPGEKISLPPEKYKALAITLKEKTKTAPAQSLKEQAKKITVQATLFEQISISETGKNVIRYGGPLDNEITINDTGESPVLDYVVKGIGGEQYKFAQQINPTPPKVNIYKDDKLISTGNFNYG